MELSMLRLFLLSHKYTLIRKARVNVYLYIVLHQKTIILSNNHGTNAKLF